MLVAVVLLSIGVVLWMYFLWKRRRFYLFSLKFPSLQGWPFIGIALRLKSLEDILYELNNIADELGSKTAFSWVGQMPFVATREPEYVEKILTSPGCLDKPFMYDVFVEALGGGLLTINSPKCTSHRKLLNPAFNHHILLSFFPIFNDATNVLIQDFDKLVNCGSFDLTQFIYACTLRISIETTMGMDGTKYRDRCLKLLPHSEIVLTTTMNRFLQPWLRIESMFRFSSSYKPYTKAKQFVDDFVNEVINIKLAEKQKEQIIKTFTEDFTTKDEEGDSIDIKKSKNIFIDQAIEMYYKNHFDWNDFFGESSSMIYAAFETTATTLLTSFIMLATHPQYQQRLYEEIVGAFPDKDSEVHYEDLEKLIYMDMVINETFRIAATVPLISRHAGTDLYISDDVTIPKGTQLLIDIFHMHRDTEIWGPNAELFNPDNFLPANLVDKHPYAFIPFSKGSRNCIGWRYATMLLKVVLAKVIRNFRVTTKFPFEDLHYVVNLTIKFKVTPQLEVHRR